MPIAQRLRRVFVVDDEPVIASTPSTILCMHGFVATFFIEPREVLLATHSETPDLMISDVVMPQLSGIELAIQVRAKCPNCKILLFSDQGNRFGPGNGGQGFEVLSKPIHPTELLRKIKELAEAAPPHYSVRRASKEDIFMLRSA